MEFQIHSTSIKSAVKCEIMIKKKHKHINHKIAFPAFASSANPPSSAARRLVSVLRSGKSSNQWPFQEPIYWRYLPYIRPIFQAYVRKYPHKIWPYMVQDLHFRILEFPLIEVNG